MSVLGRFLGVFGGGAVQSVRAELPASSRPVRTRPTWDGADQRSVGGRNWRVADVSATAVSEDVPTMRARARDIVRNFSWALQVVEVFVDDVVGWGSRPLVRDVSERRREEIQARWRRWEREADADGRLDFAGLTALVVRLVLRDGEAVVRLRPRLESDGLSVPLQLEVLESDVCPHSLTATSADEEVVQGVVLDRNIGRVKGYMLYDAAPGTRVLGSTETHFVPAEACLMVFDPARAKQRRGTPPLASVLRALNHLAAYGSLMVQRAAVAASPTGVVTPRADESPTVDPLTGETVADDAPLPELVIGSPYLQVAPAGSETKVFPTPDAPANYADFVEAALREVGAALGVPVEVFSHRWGATNDRLARVVLAQYRRRVSRFFWSVLEPQFLRPVWVAWCEAAGIEAEADWSPHAYPYIHPVQDVTATVSAVNAGLIPLRAALSEQGLDVETVLKQIAEDQKLADSLGLKLSTDLRWQNKGHGGTK